MKKVTLGLILGILLTLSFFAGEKVHAQSGQVILLSASPGTTLAANCPAAPTTPSQCIVGDGNWIWQNSTQGWFKAAPSATSGVTSFNGRTGAVVPVPSDYPDAVTSVNGKTGAVVISATTTLQ